MFLQIPISTSFHLFFHKINRILLFHPWSYTLVSEVISSWIYLVERWPCFLINASYNGFDSEDSLHGFLSIILIIIGYSGCQEIYWDIVSPLVFIVSSFHLKSSYNVPTVGWVNIVIRPSPIVMAPILGVTLWILVTVLASMKRSWIIEVVLALSSRWSKPRNCYPSLPLP